MDDDSDASASESLVNTTTKDVDKQPSRNTSIDPDVTLASAPFDGPEGDVILRTSDSMDFWVMRAILALASPVFKSMFSLPQPPASQEAPSEPPIIPVSESSSTLDLLLRLCYPIEGPRLSEQSVTLLGDVLRAALKYDIGAVVGRARRRLRKHAEESSKKALKVYGIACHLRLEDEARVAALACLTWPFPTTPVPELNIMSGYDYYNLLQYHKKASEAVASLFTKNRYIFVTSTCAGITPPNHPCAGSKKLSYTVNNQDIHVTEYFWWTSSKAVLAEAFKISPLATDKLSLWTLAPILEVTECHICKNRFFQGWEVTRETIIAEMRKKVSKVELSLSWES